MAQKINYSKQPPKKWEDWVNSNQSSLSYFNGNIDSIRNPNWHGSFHKGGNAYDFSGIHLKNVMIFDPFAEEITETVIYGISSWDIHVSEASKQSNLVIEKTYQLYSEIIAEGRIPLMVDNIELAQFIYYLSNHKKIRDTINILNKRGVLLLGKFKDGGLERLYKLRDWFAKQNYLPMIFDFDRPPSLDYTETIVTMSGLAKLVVADLSGDSVPQELHAILTNFVKPVVVYHNSAPYSMLQDLKRKNRYFHEIKFDGTDENLLSLLPPKIADAEKDFGEIILDLAKEYN